VDDGSTDDSLNVAIGYAKKDNRFKVHSRPWFKKKGANSCRNYGFKLSKGEFIQWFDSDDISDPEMLKITINSLYKGGFDMLVSNASYFKKDLNNLISTISFSADGIGLNLAFDYLTMKYFFQTSQVIFRHKTLLFLNKVFNVGLKRNQETQFFTSLLLCNINISVIKDVLVYIRVHNDSITSKYQDLAIPNKYIVDFDAYRLMYKDFHGSKSFTKEVKSYFLDYFLKSLKKANPNKIKYYHIYLFVIRYQIFPSFFGATKIFISKVLKNV
jgi:glycosyltransferase involved in cell wall biosynthesis